MKVMQVVPGISTKYGGPSIALTDMTRLLCAHGVEAVLMTTNVDPAGRLDVPLEMTTEERGARVVYFNVWPQGRYALSLPLGRALWREIRHYDVVHIHWIYNFAPAAAAMVARRWGIPYILQPNGSLDPFLMRKNSTLKHLYMASLGTHLVRNASVLIFTSEAERRRASLAKVRQPTYVVPVGLDATEYANLPRRGEFRKQFQGIGDRWMLLFLGRISRQKGLDLLMQAFRIVISKHPNAHLVVAGPDAEGYGAKVRRWIAQFSLESHVSLIGPLQERHKLAAYVDCDVFVLPSYAENFGATVAEALACRRPVVVSNQVGICDDIAATGAGIVVECSPHSVADGICRVIADPDLAKRLGESGYELVQRKFTWEVALRQLIPIYRELVR